MRVCHITRGSVGVAADRPACLGMPFTSGRSDGPGKISRARAMSRAAIEGGAVDRPQLTTAPKVATTDLVPPACGHRYGRGAPDRGRASPKKLSKQITYLSAFVERVGVDMMVGDLIRIGGEQPLIESTDSPAVRVVLGGRPVDINRYRFFSSLEPAEAREDTDAALLVWRATNLATPFLTAKSCHRLLQRTQTDAQNALLRVSTYRTAGGVRLLTPIAIPEAGPVAWRLSQPARRHLRIPQPGLAAATEWVRERRRISTAEYRALTGVSNPTAVAHLKTLAQEEGLVPSRPSGRGPGFHYRFPQDG